MKTFFWYALHQKSDQMCLVTSCRVIKINKSGITFNTELCKILIWDIMMNIWSCVPSKGVPYFCPSRIYPAIPYCSIVLIFEYCDIHTCKTGSQNPQCGLKIYRSQLVPAYSGSLGAVHVHLIHWFKYSFDKKNGRRRRRRKKKKVGIRILCL